MLATLLVASAVMAAMAGPVQITYHWHLQQPIYWPAPIPSNNNTYQKAWQSIQLSQSQGGHPQNDLNGIFEVDDRIAIYQTRAADSINSIGGCPDAGAQVSYSGCLIENVNSIAGNLGGYNVDWNSTYAKFMQSEKTSGGYQKLDFVSFTYHHALGPLIDKEALAMEIAIHKEIYGPTWGNAAYSKGFFPAEMAFSERMIPALVEAGLEWVIVPNTHLSRACKNYTFSPAGDNNDPPNAADQINPEQDHWFSQSISRGCTPNNAVPFSFTPHKAKHTDPESGKEYTITVVPAAMAMSWDDGYACYDTTDIDNIAQYNNEDHPMLILLAHDGDNAFGGGYSYYMQCVPGLMSDASSKGYHPTTIQQYLSDYPVDDNDVVHVEDGAWVNADGDFGAPQFVNWDWPLLNETGSFDIENGWALKERNWAVITAAQNYVLQAEDAVGKARPSEVQEPSSDATEAEIAWHFFLPSLTSGYMYYGAVLDMPVKQTIACNTAIDHARKALTSAKNSDDKTPPSVWALQRLPWNPGAYGAGSLWKYQYTQMTEDFYVWTFIYDVSGIASVNFYYRIDDDGVNPLSDNANEVYETTFASGVSDWKELPMVYREMPKGNVYNQSSIDFFVLPDAIADEYYVHVEGLSNVLIDYYVEATDKAGNVKKTDIYHVMIE